MFPGDTSSILFIRSSIVWPPNGGATGRDKSPVLVVGLRSIGTSLSAIVAAVLRSAGWEADRLTVRPTGHPFHREVVLPHTTPQRTSIVVDEGPGLSGSSMAAPAKALWEGGVTDITFFPGHAGEPGHQANELVKDWWKKIPRCVCPLQEITWGEGRHLADLLADQTAEMLDCARSSVVVQELAPGEWRRLAYLAKKIGRVLQVSSSERSTFAATARGASFGSTVALTTPEARIQDSGVRGPENRILCGICCSAVDLRTTLKPG